MSRKQAFKAIIARIENRINYGLISDEYDLAATYAVVIAVGHVFNDANKRTAAIAMHMNLRRNGITF
ncbi:MAG: type II toxin-antitoxin system death-on-curing family toxin [Pseudomonadota bacterium]